MSLHLVCVGGEDHRLRISFLLALREKGFRVTAISSDVGGVFSPYGISHRRFGFERFASGGGDAALLFGR
ncbi:hypothetical protein FJW08_23285 [Mesorhizobium sp. B3-2-1]|nr:hypothetical protein FJW08_23285 [Mesorhizobium sp. B3-2-1]